MTVAAVAVGRGFTGRVLGAQPRRGRGCAHDSCGCRSRGRRRRPVPTSASTGVAPWLTDRIDFYRIDTALAIPQILPKDWELRIHGMVDHEMTADAIRTWSTAV